MKTIADIHSSRNAKMTTRNDKELPLVVAERMVAHEALRKSFVVVDYSHVAIVDVSGDDAFDFLNGIISGDLGSIRDEQATYTFILDDAGHIVLDLHVLCDVDRFLILSEATNGKSLKEHLELYSAGQSVEIHDRSDELLTILFEGPYSWEIAKELFGMDVIGLPFMEHMRVSSGILFRGGNHGEFSYQVICEKDKARDLLEDRDDLYAKYHAAFAGLDFQNLARLENPCWNESRLGKYSRCPIELQYQWMVRYDKDEFIGKASLERKLISGPARRIVGFVADVEGDTGIQPGQEIDLGGTLVGIVATAGFSPDRKRTLGQALMATDYAYAEVADFKIRNRETMIPITTSTVPFVKNFSFLVNPSEHSYIDSGRHKSVLHQLEAAQMSKNN